MLKFFRTIRKNLMEQNKIRSYFLYAIGEVALVMIGILLALQVNNWNEVRRLAIEELNLLYEINENLLQSKNDIDQMVLANQRGVNSYTAILRHLKENNLEQDSLYRAFRNVPGWNSAYPTFTAYETLKQKGIDIIRNKELRKQITSIYESSYVTLINDWDKYEWVYNEAVVTPYFAKSFYYSILSIDGVGGIAVPNDLEALLADPELKNILSMLLLIRSNGQNRGRQLSNELTELITEIETELDTRGFKKP